MLRARIPEGQARLEAALRRARALEERLDAQVEDLGARVAAQRTALACGLDRERRLEASVRHYASALSQAAERAASTPANLWAEVQGLKEELQSLTAPSVAAS